MPRGESTDDLGDVVGSEVDGSMCLDASVDEIFLNLRVVATLEDAQMMNEIFARVSTDREIDTRYTSSKTFQIRYYRVGMRLGHYSSVFVCA